MTFTKKGLRLMFLFLLTLTIEKNVKESFKTKCMFLWNSDRITKSYFKFVKKRFLHTKNGQNKN